MTEQQPPDDASVEHPDLDAAVEVDDHGPAFRAVQFDDSEEEYPKRPHIPYDEPPDA